MSYDVVISRIASLITQGKHIEALLEAGRALDSINESRQSLEELERQINHLKSSVEIILQTITLTPDHLSVKPSLNNSMRRKRQVIDAAFVVVRNGKNVINVNDVKKELKRVQVTLGVTRPGSVIGTILKGDSRFKRLDPGVFEHIENQ